MTSINTASLPAFTPRVPGGTDAAPEDLNTTYNDFLKNTKDSYANGQYRTGTGYDKD